MIYLNEISKIDENIKKFNYNSLTIDKNTKYLVMHSKKNMLAPLKECICRGGKESSNYQKANGNAAFKAALALGYVSSEDVWGKGVLKKSNYEFLHDKDYIVLRFVPAKKINDVYLKYIEAEQNLRHLFGRPCERNEPLGQFGEFLYCKLFGVSENSKLNVKGNDALDPVTNRKIQIKVARKAMSNKAGIGVNISREFDLLAIFWLGEDRKVKKFFEITQEELLEIAKKKKHKTDSVDIKESDLTLVQIKRSKKKILKAIQVHGLQNIFELNYEK